MSFIQDDGSRIYAWIMYSNFGRQLLCKVIMAWGIELLRFTSVMVSQTLYFSNLPCPLLFEMEFVIKDTCI